MKPDVILIVCDTLRKDILDIYGGPAKVPNVRKFARDSMVYENCIAPATWTFPSHTSMFTGMYPSEHGVHEITRGEKVKACIKANRALSVPRIAERLEDKGYDTYCITNNFMISKISGFQYGFRGFITLNTSPWLESEIAMEARQMGADPMQVLQKLILSGRALELPKYAKELIRIREVAKKANYPRNKGITKILKLVKHLTFKPNFFLFLNLFDAHEPYPSFSDRDGQDALAGIRPINKGTVAKLKNEYVEATELVDRGLGELFEDLKRRGLYDDSLIILTSDHGQAFNEHGFMYHGIYLYDEIVRIPLIVKYPRSKKFKQKQGYQSLVFIPDLIESVLRKGNDSTLTRRSVFTEAYGNIDVLPESYDSRREYMDNKYEKARAAIYMDGYKLSVNGSDGSVEEFLKGDRPVSRNSKRHRKAFERLSKTLKNFKKKEAFVVPGK